MPAKGPVQAKHRRAVVAWPSLWQRAWRAGAGSTHAHNDTHRAVLRSRTRPAAALRRWQRGPASRGGSGRARHHSQPATGPRTPARSTAEPRRPQTRWYGQRHPQSGGSARHSASAALQPRRAWRCAGQPAPGTASRSAWAHPATPLRQLPCTPRASARPAGWWRRAAAQPAALRHHRRCRPSRRPRGWPGSPRACVAGSAC